MAGGLGFWRSTGGGGSGSLTSASARRSSGSLTLNSTSWADVDTTLDLTLAAVAGDQVLYGLTGRWGNESVWGFLDVVTVVSGTVTNSLCEQGAAVSSPSGNVEGIAGWHGVSGRHEPIAGTTAVYTVTAGDITSGNITLRLRYATLTAANKTLWAASNIPLDVYAINFGQ